MVRLTGPLSRIYNGPMAGADFLQLSPAAAPVRGLTGWLADAIRAAIMDGRLGAGTPLPATRLLAGDLGVSRGVIVEAYQRLADEGLVSARPGAGTRVLGVSRVLFRRPPGRRRPGRCWCRRAGGNGPTSTSPPACPTCPGFPRAAWIRAERAVLEQASVTELGYGDPRGSLSLRTELAGWLARTRGLRAGPGRHHRGHRGGAGARPAGPGAAGPRARRDRGRGPGLARGPGRPGLLGPAAGAGPGGRARACWSASWPGARHGRRCSRPRTSSRPGWCWPRSAAATCWTGPPRRTP